MKKVKRRSNCPINFALEIFGDRWSLLIVRDLMFKGKVYYGDFLESEEKVATNILANRLEMLESSGIIKKSQDIKNKTKYIYSLTSKGLDLAPILIEIVLWSEKYDPKTAALKEFVKGARTNRAKMIKRIKTNIVRNKSSAEKKFLPKRERGERGVWGEFRRARAPH